MNRRQPREVGAMKLALAVILSVIIIVVMCIIAYLGS